MIGALYVIGTVGSSIWVFFDAPRHGLSRGWSLGCLLVWVVFFPWYLIERSKAGEGPRGHTGAKPRSGWRARVFMDRHRRPAAVALAVALPLTMAGIWELRLLFRGLYMLFVVRHPALISIPLLLGAAAFVVHPPSSSPRAR